ncbi:MAG: flagellin [Actinobacteria bacterium 13_2_20CM_2_72_6]|nr:MAG: flagellin [Actinobacteria bacterium 13_2_20CM_2_72_6]
MSLRINSNIAAVNAYRNLSSTDKAMKNSLEKLSSGLRINRAADDAAGLSISQGLQSQIGGLQVAARNAQDGINVVQTADGALGESEAILQRMRDLAVQSSNSGSQDASAQSAAQTEFGQLNSELDRIVSTTKFGSQKVLDGTYQGNFQVDSGTGAGSQISVDLSSATLGGMAPTGAAQANAADAAITGLDSAGLGTSTLSLTGAVSVNGHSNQAQDAVDQLDDAIKFVSTVRANLGAYQNRFDHTINNINVAVENLSASKSAITDTDMAQEMTNFTKSQILQQAGTAMLAQANQAPQGVLKLLG